MMKEIAEDAVAVLGVLAGVEDMVVPHQVDEGTGDEGSTWVAEVKREKPAVVTFRNGWVDRLAVQCLSFAFHLEKDGAKVDID